MLYNANSMTETHPPMESASEAGADGLNLLTVPEVARLLHVTTEAVRLHVRQGRLGALRIGDGKRARIRIPSSSLAEYLRETSRPPVETR